MAEKIGGAEKLEKPEEVKKAPPDERVKLKEETKDVNGHKVTRVLYRRSDGKEIEICYEEVRPGVTKKTGEVTIEEHLEAPKGKERRVVSFLKPAGEKEMGLHRFFRVEEKCDGEWVAIPETETDMDAKGSP
ncbi:MAG: hypothetical protein AAB967_04420 [Patescibacteria group bacterium]